MLKWFIFPILITVTGLSVWAGQWALALALLLLFGLERVLRRNRHLQQEILALEEENARRHSTRDLAQTCE